jgi:hypothetical protein
VHRITNMDPDDIYDILFALSETGDPPEGAARLIDVGTTDYLNYFENEILDEYIARGGATCRFFEGHYGSGKTHILQLIKDIALDKGYLVVHIDLKKDLNFERWDQITRHILENCYIQSNGQKIKNFPEILSALEFSKNLNKKKIFDMNFSHPCLQNAIKYGLSRSKMNDDEWSYLRSYLLGEKVRVYDLKRNGLKNIKKSLNQNNAEQFLNTFLNSYYNLTGAGVVLLFDETDRLWDPSNRIPLKVKIASNLIRRFIDACSNNSIKGTLAVFAVLPNFIRDCVQCYPALGQRLEVYHPLGDICWRSTLTSVNDLNSEIITINDSSEQRRVFLNQAIVKFIDILKYCNINTDNFQNELIQEGIGILKNCAGDNYKRELIKYLTSKTVDRIDKYAEK